MYRLYCVIIGYFFGCIQSAYFIAKFVKKIDIRQHGSGNAGSTNVSRILGKKAGLTVFFIDVFKAIIVYYICSFFFQGSGSFLTGNVPNGILPGLYAGVGVILGHNFPFFLNFKGGKGSASGIGLILSTDLTSALICTVMAVIVIAITKYVSLTSIVLIFTFFIYFLTKNFSHEITLITLFLFLLSIFQHRQNIQRIINKTESKIKLY